jgi:thymidylate synthase (FAD)
MDKFELLNQYFPVLDYGFVALKDWMGNDNAFAEMARNSYKLGTEQINDNEGLIRHLMRHRHTSPFERCEIVLHCGMPIFVARQWVRHRTASLNEYSGRYSVMPMLFYTPSRDRCQRQSETNKQGSSISRCFDDQDYSAYQSDCDMLHERMKEAYQSNIDCDMARELARINLPLSMYTYWYWKIDIHNLLHFSSLRLAKDAQWEIRQYAKVIAGIAKILWPITWKAFEDYRLNGATFSRGELLLIRHLDTGGCLGWEWSTIKKSAEECGLTATELREFLDKWHTIMDEPEEYELDFDNVKSSEFYEKLAQDSIE